MGDLQHQGHQRLGALQQRLALFADGGERDAGEHGEHDDLQDLVAGQRIEGRSGDQVGDEILQGELVCRQPG